MPGAVVKLSELNGINGFRIVGAAPLDQSGGSVSSAGDVNGDGLNDLIVGAHRAKPGGLFWAGSSFVVFGRTDGFGPSLDLSTLSGTAGYRFNGEDEIDGSGRSVSNAGDFNGDGLDDLIIGAPYAGPSGRTFAGSSYVVFGRLGGFAPALELSSLDGANGFRLDGPRREESGYSVSSAGDVNGDGYADLIIGAPRADPEGRLDAGSSYVVFGRAGGIAPVNELSALDGQTGFRLDGALASDKSGCSVSSAGDVNGDGFDDLIIGAAQFDVMGGHHAGGAYVVFGHSGDFAPVLELSALNGKNGFRLEGVNNYDQTGMSVSSAGDVNGDGFDDVIIGARNANPQGRSVAGSAYVVFGRPDDFAAVLQLSALNGINGFRLDGAREDDQAGSSVSSAGDVNGDGVDDLIVGAPAGRFGDDREGASYVVFGRSGGFPSVVDLSNLTASAGFRLDGEARYNRSGSSVSSAGDVNGDGFDDLIVGAPSADPGGRPAAGQSYVIFGKPSPVPPILSGDFAVSTAPSARVALSLDDLSASDVESGADELVFTMTATIRGFVALDAAPLTAATGFTQADLAAGRVSFVHGGSAKPTAGFTVRVQDSGGDVAGPQTISVTVVPSPTPPFRVEAEDFALGAGFAVKTRHAASGRANIEAIGFEGEAVATWTFDRPDGLYDLALGHFDESDGVARMRLLVNGEEIGGWDWDSPLGWDRPNAQSLRERLFEDVALETGDVIELRGTRAVNEPVRTDYLDFVWSGDLPV